MVKPIAGGDVKTTPELSALTTYRDSDEHNLAVIGIQQYVDQWPKGLEYNDDAARQQVDEWKRTLDKSQQEPQLGEYWQKLHAYRNFKNPKRDYTK